MSDKANYLFICHRFRVRDINELNAVVVLKIIVLLMNESDAKIDNIFF